MMIIFRTDGSVSHRGFSARYDTDQPALCGGELNVGESGTGFFTSPGFQSPTMGNYSASLICDWQLNTADSVNSSVAFTIESMDIEGPMASTGSCAYDALEFYGGK